MSSTGIALAKKVIKKSGAKKSVKKVMGVFVNFIFEPIVSAEECLIGGVCVCEETNAWTARVSRIFIAVRRRHQYAVRVKRSTAPLCHHAT